MATLKQSRSLGTNPLAARISRSYAGLSAGIARLFGVAEIDTPQIDAVAEARAAQLFAQALHEDSNIELGWLWYAANMTSTTHRRTASGARWRSIRTASWRGKRSRNL